jgi:membrane associated rhomboid family serine protease
MILPGNIFFKKDQLNLKSIANSLISSVGLLVVLNIFVHFFIIMTEPDDFFTKRDFQYLKNKSNLAVMQDMQLETQPSLMKNAVTLKTESDPYLFLKDTEFWSKAQTQKFSGDQIQIKNNKDILKRLSLTFNESSQKMYGLGPVANSALNWVTYQFTHASFFHLFSNLFFLIVIGAALKSVVSDQWIVMTYILSGLTAGVFYLLLCDDLSHPLVGASGSISGLIAFLCVVKNNKNIQWSYFISPFKNGQGNIYLPAYLLFPIYLMTDFTQVLIDSVGVTNSIAHSAHVGGALCGLVLGFLHQLNLHFSSKFSTQ